MLTKLSNLFPNPFPPPPLANTHTQTPARKAYYDSQITANPNIVTISGCTFGSFDEPRTNNTRMPDESYRRRFRSVVVSLVCQRQSICLLIPESAGSACKSPPRYEPWWRRNYRPTSELWWFQADSSLADPTVKFDVTLVGDFQAIKSVWRVHSERFCTCKKMFISNFMTLAIETVSSTLLASFPLNFLVEQDDIKLWLERLTQHRGLVQSDVEPCEMMQLLDKIESSKVTRFNSGGDAESCQMMLSHVRWCWVVKGAIMSDVAESQMLSHVT